MDCGNGMLAPRKRTVASHNLLAFGQFLMGFSGMLQMHRRAAPLNAEARPLRSRARRSVFTMKFISNTLSSVRVRHDLVGHVL